VQLIVGVGLLLLLDEEEDTLVEDEVGLEDEYDGLVDDDVDLDVEVGLVDDEDDLEEEDGFVDDDDFDDVGLEDDNEDGLEEEEDGLEVVAMEDLDAEEEAVETDSTCRSKIATIVNKKRGRERENMMDDWVKLLRLKW